MAVSVVPKRLTATPPVYVPGSATAIYTAGAGVTGVIEKIAAFNRDVSDQVLTMWVGGTGSVNRIFAERNIVTGTALTEKRVRVVPPGMSLYAAASVISGLSIDVSGAEVSGVPNEDETVVVTPKQLGQQLISDVYPVIYTPDSAAITGIIHTITLMNFDIGVPHLVQVFLDEDDGPGRVLEFTLPGFTDLVLPEGIIVIPFGGSLCALADTPSVVTITVDGSERETLV